MTPRERTGTMTRTAALALAAFLIVSCAGQAPPPGGPEDRTPPEIITTYPEPYSTYYSDRMIVLEFSEYVDRRSLESAVFVSPDVGALAFDWSGREVEITFEDSLKSATTYVVTVGTDVVDLRGRNRMARAASLAFSTGGEIDRGAIAGVVYGESNEAARSGVLVMAYRLDGLDPDTLDARRTKPDYVTQTGSAGEFALRHLKLGRYRLLALRDEYRNLLYDPQTDAFGLLGADLALSETDTLIAELGIKMALQDTTGPTLIKATGRSPRMVELEFSEPIRNDAVPTGAVQVIDTLTGRGLEVLAVAVRHPNRVQYQLMTAMQDSLGAYRIIVTGVQDSAGNAINPSANSLTLSPAPTADTAGFQFTAVSVRDSARSLPFRPSIELYGLRPAKTIIPAGAVTIQDTLGRNIPVEHTWRGSLTLSVRPVRDLASETWYKLTVREQAFEDVQGRRGRDTTITVAFQIISADLLGSIEGSVADLSTDDATGPIVVFAQGVDRTEGGSARQTIPAPGPFVLSNLDEGRYVLAAFRDRNANGLFDPGSVAPHAPSERFRLGSDTLRVRARWPYEGAILRLR